MIIIIIIISNRLSTETDEQRAVRLQTIIDRTSADKMIVCTTVDDNKNHHTQLSMQEKLLCIDSHDFSYCYSQEKN